MKKKCSILLCLCMVLLLMATGCADTEEEMMNTAANLANATKTIGDGLLEMGKTVIHSAQATEDVHVEMVKNGINGAHPNVTYGEAFDNYFAGTSWRYFSGTEEGSDVPVDVVEFKGNCLYLDTEVTALIQFELDPDGKHFNPVFLSFNDVPQDILMMGMLIEEAFQAVEQPQSQPQPQLPQEQPAPTLSFLGDWIAEDGRITAEITKDDGYRILITEHMDDISWRTWVLNGEEDKPNHLNYTGQMVELSLREDGTVMQDSAGTPVEGYMEFDEWGTLNWADMSELMQYVVFFTRQ